MSDFVAALRSSIAKREPVARVVVVRAPTRALLGRQMLVWPEKDPLGDLSLDEEQRECVLHESRAALDNRRHEMVTIATEAGEIELWVEVQVRPPTLVIVGAGHIAQPLAQVGRLCDFTVVVIDDRPKFANRERFPEVDEVIAAPFDDALAGYKFDPDTYVILVTRGHQYDVEALLQIIDEPLAYIGMIGSRRRIKGVFELIREEHGLTDEQLAQVYAPIGLDVGAETPAEIAVAIIAEITLVRRGGTGVPLSDALWDQPRRVHTWRSGTGQRRLDI